MNISELYELQQKSTEGQGAESSKDKSSQPFQHVRFVSSSLHLRDSKKVLVFWNDWYRNVLNKFSTNAHNKILQLWGHNHPKYEKVFPMVPYHILHGFRFRNEKWISWKFSLILPIISPPPFSFEHLREEIDASAEQLTNGTEKSNLNLPGNSAAGEGTVDIFVFWNAISEFPAKINSMKMAEKGVSIEEKIASKLFHRN